MWLAHPDFRYVVSRVWSEGMLGNSCDKVRGYLGRFKFLVHKWNKDTFGNLVDKKKALMSELNKIQQDNMSLPMSNYLLNKECDIKRQLYHVLRDEEIFWAQKARVIWLQLGDKNTRCFQTVTNI
ncbi:hypothetical protein ACFX1R_023577 [Malus domestica]